jgi:hypothetical protein
MKISEFLKDDTDRFSSQRLVFLVGYLVFFGLWIITSIKEKKISPIDTSVVYFLVVLSASKVSQSITDNLTPPKLKE